jgi:hypothetical protein
MGIYRQETAILTVRRQEEFVPLCRQRAELALKRQLRDCTNALELHGRGRASSAACADR